MLDAFKRLFGTGDGDGASPLQPRKNVNLEKRFNVVAETAQGSMSRVCRAYDIENDRAVCLKVQLKDKNEAAAARAGQGARLGEGEIGARIKHPNIAETFEFGESNKGERYIVLEYVDGLSLNAFGQTEKLSLADRMDLLAQAAEGLAAVHAHGFIHHDIAPKNFLVDRRRRVKLIDFGLAVPNTDTFHKPGNRTGTMQYMAPELLRREPTDERIDIFSFGVVAFEFLTGRLPYDGGGNSMSQMIQRINQDPCDPAKANPKLPEPICELLRRTLAKRKEDRWPKMETLAATLRKMAEKLKKKSRKTAERRALPPDGAQLS